MRIQKRCSCVLGFVVFLSVLFLSLSLRAAEPSLAAADKLDREGNYKDACNIYAKIAFSKAFPAKESAKALEMGVLELRRINRVRDIDRLINNSVAARPDDWPVLYSAAKMWMDVEHFGYLIGGEFVRGSHRGGGEMVNSYQRDRVLALRLFKRAAELAESAGASPRERYEILNRFAGAVMYDRGYDEAWRLQILTNLDKLPELEKNVGIYYFYSRRTGAPVNPDGSPVFFNLPKSFAAAKNDGERWRWLINEAAVACPEKKYVQLELFANFLQEQFGVQTMAFDCYRDRGKSAELVDDGPYSVHTLAEDETIAQLATGLKRFKLPDEFNFIKIQREIAASDDRESARKALDALADIFTNRRQYDKAAEIWRECVSRYGQNSNGCDYKDALDQIVANWGRFEPTLPETAGRPGKLLFRFRNAREVSFVARKINIDKLLEDVKKYIESNPLDFDWYKVRLSNIGYDLVKGDRKKYVGEKVAEWSETLSPAKHHFDKIVKIKVPLEKGGAYLVTAKVADGNTSNIVLWLNDAVLVRKELDNSILYFVADAETGQPLGNANLEFFGYIRDGVGTPRRHKKVNLRANADGMVIVDWKTIPRGYSWLVTATSEDGMKKAFLGFNRIWYGRRGYNTYGVKKAYLMTDRPVYRPKQTVRFKLWVRRARYDLGEGQSTYAGRAFRVEIRDPRGGKIYAKTLTADEFGGISGELALPESATLGNYRISVGRRYGGTFRVEEYRKPEFEVSIEAPKAPVALGDSIKAVIQAKYYFGAPVTNAKVRYKVTRTPRDSRWFPPSPWDWLYGPGYWWFGCKRYWYPGWSSWGCAPPSPWWYPHSSPRPELVMENEVTIGRDGTVEVEIDTAVAKALFGDIDQNYAISAEVVDQSRRMVAGAGNVVAAVKPFNVTAWLERGFLLAGETATARFAARTVLGDPVSGKCVMKLLKITYDGAGKPSETQVEVWEPRISADGTGSVQFKAAAPGQYRLSCVVTDAKGASIEGGYIFTVRGDGSKWSATDGDFRFNDIELVSDKREYAPGEKATLMISTNRPESFVLLFPRAGNGSSTKPTALRLTGKTAFADLAIAKGDMPNIFVEAITVSNGRVHKVVREIVVPPEKRVLNVEIVPNHPKNTFYKPGEKAKLKIKVTDIFGNPVKSSVVMTLYDKAVEYISGGSNVPDIKPFFWKWRRRYSSSYISNTTRFFRNIVEGDFMLGLGVFGEITADSGATDVDDENTTRASEEGTLGVDYLGGHVRKKGGTPAPAAMSMNEAGDGGSSPPAERTKVAIRSNFADTAYWNASITPNADGIAEVVVPMPENLTTWVARVWSIAGGTRVGEGRAEIITSKDFLLRLIASRFLVDGDEATFSAVIHNRTKSAKTAKVALKLDGKVLRALDSTSTTRSVEIPADGETRVDWRIAALAPGEAKVVMTAVAGEDSDGMEVKLPVLVHGIEKQVAFTGSIPAESSAKTASMSEKDTLAKGRVWCDAKTKTAKFAFTVPKDRRTGETTFTLRYSPTLAGAMIDALPYLVAYPYGCTEQTLNRFLPTVITRNVLRRMKVNLANVAAKRANLNATELGDSKERAKQWSKYLPNGKNPVFDEKIVDDMVKDGIRRLGSMRCSDGGWGWFSGYGERSYPDTTALVVRGLLIAKRLGAAVPANMIGQGVGWLRAYQSREIRKIENAGSKMEPYKPFADDLDALVLSVLADAGDKSAGMKKMTDLLYRDRTKISVYSKCLLALAIHKRMSAAGKSADLAPKLDMLIRNVEQFLVKNQETQTAYLDLGSDNYWWCWYGSESETMAAYLKLLAATKPKSETAAWLVKYLLDNRKHGARWSSTRDTALVIEAMADYILATGEDKPDMTVKILIDGKPAKSVKIDGSNLFSYDDRLVLNDDALAAGKHICEIRVDGAGPLYFSAYLKYFSLEKFIEKTGLRIKTRRRYYKLERVKGTAKTAGVRGQVVDMNVERYKRVPLANLAEVKSGDLVEVELLVDSDNDYEYIMLQDHKPAGFEPMENRSGYNGNAMGAYVEFRDAKVCFFVRSLARGSHSLSYRLRAETPGKFSALPAIGAAMYAPELKSNSDEFKVQVGE